MGKKMDLKGDQFGNGKHTPLTLTPEKPRMTYHKNPFFCIGKAIGRGSQILKDGCRVL